MGETFYSILRGDEFVTVKGIKLTPHFACRIEKGFGYRITHLPTSWLLSTTGFESLEVAQRLAELLELEYGKRLDSQNVRFLADLAETDPKFARYHQLIEEMNNSPKRTISGEDLSEMMGRIFNGQQA